MSKSRAKSVGPLNEPAKGKRGAPKKKEEEEEEEEILTSKSKRQSVKEPTGGARKKQKKEEEPEESEAEPEEEEEAKVTAVKPSKPSATGAVKATPKGGKDRGGKEAEDAQDPMETPKGKAQQQPGRGRKTPLAKESAVKSRAKGDKADQLGGESTNQEEEEEAALTEEQFKKLADSWSPNQVKSELLSLQKKYQSILDLRRTQAEQLLAEVQANAEEKTDVAQRLISKLKAETKKLAEENTMARSVDHERIRALENQLEESNEELKKLQAAEVSQQAKGSSKKELAALHEKLHQLQRITGLKVISVETGTQTKIHCLQSGLKGSLEFSLLFKDDTIDYTPIKHAVTEGSIPDYLEEEIQFEDTQLTLFFWRIIDALQNSDA